MFRALWFLTKLAVLIALAVWIAQNPGYFTIQWLDYTITAHIGAGIIALLAVIIVSSYTGRAFAYIRHFPRIMKRYRYIKGSAKGMDALTKAYGLAASGQIEKAQKYLARSDQKFPERFHRGLVLSLKAHLAGKQGDSYARRQYFAALAEMKDVGVIGLQGIVQQALENGDTKGARDILDQYLKDYKYQPWFMRLRYQLALDLGQWEEARGMLEDRHFKKAREHKDIRSDLVALHVLESDRAAQSNETAQAISHLKKALRLDHSFTPAVTRLARIYLDLGKVSAARSLLLRSWERCPHPDLALYLDKVFYERKRTGSAERIKWYRKIAGRCPGNLHGAMALARVALEEKDWPAARKALEEGGQIGPTAGLYYLWAEYEQRANHDALAYNSYMRKAAQACPDPRWVCKSTGHIYERWQPVALPHGSFNTIIWAIPQALKLSRSHILYSGPSLALPEMRKEQEFEEILT